MSDRLFLLLPEVIRTRDAERGFPLRDLLRVLGQEVDGLEAEIRRMYADLFIETCEPWVVPYLGDLVGYLWFPVPEGRPSCDEPEPFGMVPRRAVGDALRNRRRKGTRAVLDDLALAVSGWPATICDSKEGPYCSDLPPGQVSVKGWRLPSGPLTNVRPYMLPRRTNTFALSVLGNDAQLYRHSAASRGGTGPQLPEPLTVAMLRDLQDEGRLGEVYGKDRSLSVYEDGRPIATERIVVQDLDGWQPEVFGDKVALDPERGRVMFPERYRSGRITASYHHGFPMAIGGGEYLRPSGGVPLMASLFREAHLNDPIGFLEVLGTHEDDFTVFLRGLLDPAILTGPTSESQLRAELNRVLEAYDLGSGPVRFNALDPEAKELAVAQPEGPARLRLNRLILEAHYPEHVRRSYARERVASRDDVGAITAAVRKWQNDRRPPLHLVVELADSGLYVEPVIVDLPADHTLELRASSGCRPTIVLPERRADIDDMTITCGDRARVLIDGLMISGYAVRIIGHPAEVVVRHCTLVPGWRLDSACVPCCGAEPSLVLTDVGLSDPDRTATGRTASKTTPQWPMQPTCVTVESSSVGTIIVQREEVVAEPVVLQVARSIVDSTTVDGNAIAAPNDRDAYAVATITESTVVGMTRVHAIALAENSIFTNTVRVARRQIGCLRYSYVPPGSRTPRRYACQPDLVTTAAQQDPDGPEAERVRPKFMTLRYGKPDYCRLDDSCAAEIREGADDASAMGVYHDLHEPRREANLRAALTEYLPLGWQLTLDFKS